MARIGDSDLTRAAWRAAAMLPLIRRHHHLPVFVNSITRYKENKASCTYIDKLVYKPNSHESALNRNFKIQIMPV